MKRFIFAILFISASFSFSAMPGTAFAKRHHRRVHRTVVYRTAAPRSHGADVNGNVGVGLGPIHVGAGAGGGIHLHAFPTPPADPPGDPMSYNGHQIVHPGDCDITCYVDSTAMTSSAMSSTGSSSGPAVMCPSSDPSSSCNLNTEAMSVTPSVVTPSARSMERFALSPDTNVNNYYATYAQPNVVTVGGFSVPVANDRMYFSPFRHRHGAAWHVHNEKGVDQTAGFGISPRAGPLPESIGGSAYSVTTVEQ